MSPLWLETNPLRATVMEQVSVCAVYSLDEGVQGAVVRGIGLVLLSTCSCASVCYACTHAPTLSFT